ncbi:hypothetical protein NOV72_03724 [Caballeronia novacaledonica]|uniref:DUF2635 domain-containing protein n=1 Tax=Caballeronia novacaledonica TaxID=1544861 RepID=A0A2U3I8I7_9BURK|nr:DUF2635 domain-containing protein [Caballeronia novacaledonica]SPB16525.1 hypothetical protein NOV72_03724 [Caballeronia novacaledonica]
MRIKPVSGRQVPDPEKGGYLPEKGREVEPNVYWLRRIEDGDVTEVAADDGESQPVKKGTK